MLYGSKVFPVLDVVVPVANTNYKKNSQSVVGPTNNNTTVLFIQEICIFWWFVFLENKTDNSKLSFLNFVFSRQNTDVYFWVKKKYKLFYRWICIFQVIIQMYINGWVIENTKVYLYYLKFQ